MRYDMNWEPGHAELVAEVVHPDLADYQPGASHYETLMGQLEQAQRFQQPNQFELNV